MKWGSESTSHRFAGGPRVEALSWEKPGGTCSRPEASVAEQITERSQWEGRYE